MNTIILPAQLVGGQAFFDPISRDLYSYDVDNQTIHKFDFAKMRWEANLVDRKPHTIFLHHNKEFSASDSSLYIFAGYGQHEYKNRIQQVRLENNQWINTEESTDVFKPRYLSASGHSKDTIYIVGGYGSPSGSQMQNPQTYSHILAYSIDSHKFSREMAVNLPLEDICFSNSMLINQKSRSYYALAFQLLADKTSLQLVQGSLDNPTMTLMADHIPYYFHDVKSYADLFYFPKSDKLIAYTSFLQEDQKSAVQLYSLLFPPNIGVTPKQEEQQLASGNYLLTFIIVLASAIVILIPLMFYYRKRKSALFTSSNDSDGLTKVEESVHQSSPEIKQSVKSTILFFGGFQVYDSQGIDITGKFTPLLKELFLLMWIYTLKDNKGISSERLTEILWFDKSSDSARNNKAVNIAKLRAILTEIGDCEITHKTGYWKINCDSNKIYNDYSEYLNLTQSKTNLTKQSILQLIKIAEKGAVLLNMNYSWLDEFKGSLSEKLIETLYFFAKKLEIQEDPNLIVQIADCIFSCDSINEEAMVLKCKAQHVMGSHSISKNTYTKFCKYYTELYDQEYETSFSDIINLPLDEIVNY